MSKSNPLHEQALTTESVKSGDRIVVYVPHTPSSANRYKVLNEPYVDDDGDLVVELQKTNGQEVTLLTSEAGLSGGRYDGIWTHVALIEEE
jgi:hypothetical protein